MTKLEKALNPDRAKLIHNEHFRKLFIKNWIAIFLYMMIPLVIFISVLWFYSNKTLLQEVDVAAERSTNGTVATINTLLEEMNTTLEKLIMDDTMYSFFTQEYSTPVPYSFVKKSTDALAKVEKEYREYLYHSVDAYSEIPQYLLSVQWQGIRYERLPEKEIVDNFRQYVEANPKASLFALPLSGVDDNVERAIVIYRRRTIGNQKDAFVSISVDAEKLCGYIVDTTDYVRQRYLIVDDNQSVVIDTAGIMNGDLFTLPKGASGAHNIEIGGEQVRVFYKDIDYFGWKCIQLVPIVEIQRTGDRMKVLSAEILLLALISSALLSFGATSKLFRPIGAILNVIENPSRDLVALDDKGEIQYLLISVLETFEKNILLEQQMLERVSALRRVRAKALQDQMTPHFLTNVLQAINWLAMEETQSEDSDTCKAIVLLAEIMCAAKSQTMNVTTVEEEMYHVEKFFELEKLRFGSNIHLHNNVTMEAEKCPIPCFSLQVLVENSIIHGLQPKEGIGNIYIYVEALQNGGMALRVEDDGIGMPQDRIEKIWEELKNDYIYLGEHFGIINLFQRFRLIFGDQCQFDIRKSGFGGTCVEISTPQLPEYWMISGQSK